MHTIRTEQEYTSQVDGAQDRYIMEHPAQGPYGPLVFYLHGGLSYADQGFSDEFEGCFLRLRDEVMRRGGVYVSPDYRGPSWMNAPAEADLVALTADLKARFKTERVILTGASMGGTSVLILASRRPEVFDGVIALCPATDMRKLYASLAQGPDPMFQQLVVMIAQAYGGAPEQVPAEYERRSSVERAGALTMPVVISHGTEDAIVPVDHSRLLVSKLRAQGKMIRYDEILGGDHGAPLVSAPWREYFDFVL